MGRYALRRVGEAVVTLLIVSVITFTLLHLLPGNIGWILLGRDATAAKAARLDAQLGLTLPLPVQFLRWLRVLFEDGGLAAGLSLAPSTLEFLAAGGGLALLLAVGLALLQARSPGSLFDRVSTALAYFFYTVPSFWLGLLLIYTLAINALWFPANGPYDAAPSQGLMNWLYYMTLPIITLALTTTASWSVYIRTAVEDALHSHYARTARAKGMTEERVLINHVLKNAALPIITLVGMSLPSLFNNLIVLELVYNMIGLGTGLIGSLESYNYGFAVDIVFAIALITVAGNLIADLLYALADPRIEFS